MAPYRGIRRSGPSIFGRITIATCTWKLKRSPCKLPSEDVNLRSSTHLTGCQGAAGSNPAAPAIINKGLAVYRLDPCCSRQPLWVATGTDFGCGALVHVVSF